MLKVHKRSKPSFIDDDDENETSTDEENETRSRCRKKKKGSNRELDDSFIVVKSKKDKWQTFYSYILTFSQHYLEEWNTSLSGQSILKLSEFVCSAATQIFGKIDILSNPIAIVVCPSYIFTGESEMSIPYLASDSVCITDDDELYGYEEPCIEQAKFFILLNVYGILELSKTSEIDYWGKSASNILSSTEVLRRIYTGGRDKLNLEINCRIVRIACVSILHALARIDLYCNKRAKLSNTTSVRRSVYGNLVHL